MIDKYNTYILGAGASFHAGLPTLSDFFHKAEALCKGNKAGQPACNGYNEAVELIRAYRSANVKKCDPQNVEDVYRLALESDNASIMEALDLVILGVLDLQGCLVDYDGKKYRANRIYESFIEKLFPYDEDGWTHRKNIHDTAIITFNWDCLIDYAMFYNNLEPYYGVGQFHKPNTPKLFKMHGSINWGYCRACNSVIQPFKPQDFVGTRHMREPVEFDLRIITEGLGRKKCSCGNALAPKIIPPTHRKNLPAEIIGLWNEAKEFLVKAHKITFIGYSLPKTDLDFLTLVQNALSDNIDLMVVDIVDPRCSEEIFKGNYRNVFGKHSKKINFYQEDSFEKYVASML